MSLHRSILCFASFFLAGSLALAIEYPETRRVDHVDTLHGIEVPDPYRWLEADVRQSQEVAEWVAAQGKLAREYLDAIPARQVFLDRLEKLQDYERFSIPWTKGGKYFFLRNSGLQDQSVLYTAPSPTGEGRVLLDPNEWSEDGTVALAGVALSDDARLMAYSKSSAGSDWKTIHVRDVESGQDLSDVLEWVRFGGVKWDHKAEGFYYSRYPEPPQGEEFQTVALNQKIYYHKLGTPQSEDQLIYERPDHPDWSFGVSLTDDGEWLVLSIGRGTDPQNQIWLKDLRKPDSEFEPVVDNFDNEFEFIEKQGGRFYFLTDLQAPRKRVVAMPADDRDNWQEIIPQQQGTLVDVSLVGGQFFAKYLEDVKSRIMRHDLDGQPLGEVELPGVGTAHGFGGEPDAKETFFSFTSLNWPTVIGRVDIATGKSQIIRRPQIDFDSDQYVTEQVFYESKDGTRIPMTLAYRKGQKQAGPNPTVLYGYGGFNISIMPSFSTSYAAWMEQGGVVAIANLRGGGEYGEQWHLAGKKENKQNVFDDFIAAAEYLIESNITTSDKLAIMGRSNGGLLVGAAMTQRPDLFGACLPAVGVHDMLRFQKFTAGQFWRSEFGSADQAEDFPVLLAYSPYHNVKPGTKFPPTLVTTADTDDRVVPMHSFKFAAALQHAQAGDAPILLRVESKAGHGAGTPVSKQLEETADLWGFLAKHFELDVKPRTQVPVEGE